MSFRVRKGYLLLLAVSVLLGSALVYAERGEVFVLKDVRYNYVAMSPDTTLFSDAVGSRLFDLEFGTYADSLLHSRKILKVDINYSLPNGIEVTLNNLEPLAVIAGSGEIRGIDRFGHIIPFSGDSRGIDYPVLTGIGEYDYYRKINDRRIELVLECLKDLKECDRDCYLMITNIDFSDSECISVYVEGLNTEVIMYAGDLKKNMRAVEAFLVDYDPDLEQVKRLDLRSEGLIIAVTK
jgi:hypothetical protein